MLSVQPTAVRDVGIHSGTDGAVVSALRPELLIAALIAQGKSPAQAAKETAEAFEALTPLSFQAPPLADALHLRVYQVSGRYRRWKRKNYPRTYVTNNHGHFRHILKNLGKLRLAELTPSRIEEFQEALLETPADKKKAPLMPQTINLICNTLYAMLSWYAKRDREPRLSRNPMKGWRDVKVTNRRKFIISNDEMMRFLRACNPIFRLMVLFACRVGLREGEVIALEWSEIDRANRRVNLSEDKVKDDEDRTIVLDDSALAILDMVPKHIPSRYVFPNPRTDGVTPYPKGTVYQWLVKARKEAGLTNLGRKRDQPLWFHSMRKVAASSFMANGMDPEMIRNFLGHSDEEVTRLYKVVSPEYANKALAAMNANPLADNVMDLLRGDRRDAKAAPPMVPVASKASRDGGE